MDVKGTKSGFTMVEIMMAIGILAVVMSGVFAVYITSSKLWYSSSLYTRVSNNSSLALEKIVYGVKFNPYYPGLRSALSDTVVLAVTGTSWIVSYDTPDTTNNSFTYNAASRKVFFNPGGLTESLEVADNIYTSTVTTNTDGIYISVTTAETDGRYSYTNAMSTYMSYRN